MTFRRALVIVSMILAAAAGLVAKGDGGRLTPVPSREWQPAAAAVPLPGSLRGPAAQYAAGGGASDTTEHCGGAYERACCVLERDEFNAACAPDMVEVFDGCPAGNCTCGGFNPAGVQSVSSCYPLKQKFDYVSPGPCGGAGQRACTLAERGNPCDGDLRVQITGCSGDCNGFNNSVSSGMCFDPQHDFPTGNLEPTTNRATELSRTNPLLGYADLHLHLFADTAHGGGVLAGAAYDPNPTPDGKGVTRALAEDYGTNKDLVGYNGGEQAPLVGCPYGLSPCGITFMHKDHALDDAVGSLGTNDGAGSNFGWPLFNGWPRWTSTTHEQTYYTWLRRAYEGGLRLTTMLAVTNSAMCMGNRKVRGTICDDSMTEIKHQLTQAKTFEAWIAANDGGWFKIVKTPADARNAIKDGKLAVVLGIEVDNLFNCKFPSSQVTPYAQDEYGRLIPGIIQGWNFSSAELGGECTPDGIRKQLKDLYDNYDVRHVFPVHNFDNGYGAPAAWMSGIEIGNRVTEGHWWVTENCPAEPDGSQYVYKSVADSFGNFMADFTRFLGLFPSYEMDQVDGIYRAAQTTTCNSWGLFPLGQSLITALMDQGMVIDVDHMSRYAFDETLTMAEARRNSADPNDGGYPVVATHVLSFDMHTDKDRHERMRTKEQLQRIRQSGGMIAAMLKDDVQDTSRQHENVTVAYPPFNGPVVNDCQQSSKSFAQAYMYAVDQMGGPVAFGSDFNGIAAHVGPRFGSDGCGGFEAVLTPERQFQRNEQYAAQGRKKAMANPLVYPFTIDGFGTFDRQTTGLRTFDFNVDGMAHVGLLPDFVADLKRVGMPQVYTDSIMQSAEQYIRVWERAQAHSLAGAPVPDGDVPSNPTLGSIAASPNPARVGDVVQFSQNGITAGANESYLWSFGDGSTATGVTVQHAYTSTGEMDVTLTVTGRNAYAHAELYVDITGGTPPVVTLTGPATSTVNRVEFYAFSAHSDDGGALTLQPVMCGANGQIAGGPVVTSVGFGDTQYAVLCRFTARDAADAVTVRFTDLAGRSGSATTTVAVAGMPPTATLTGPATLAGGASGHYAVQGTATDNDPITLTAVSCGGNGATNQSGDTDPGNGLNATFDCTLPAGAPSMDVSVTLHDADGDTTRTINVVNSGGPVVTLAGPIGSRIGNDEFYSFSAVSQDGSQPTLGPASCGQGNTIKGPAITRYDTESGFTEFGIRCIFNAKNPATIVSVSFVDGHQHTGAGTLTVNVAGLPPAATLNGPGAPVSTGVNHYVIVGTATDNDPVSLVSVSCGSGTLSGQQPNAAASPNLSVGFDCAFPNGPQSPTITAIVADGDGQTARTLTATVVDTTPPVVTVNGSATPGPMSVAGTSAQGAAVTFAVSATDNFGGTVTPSCSPASGTIFPFHETTVVCTATDAAHNIGSAFFTVTVTDTHPPTIDPLSNMTLEATGPNGAVANYITPASHDDLSGDGLATCQPAAGTLLPLGHTTVTCHASDFAGNAAVPVTFDVFVHDSTAPVITVADVVVNATSVAGAVVNYSATASDLVDGPIVPVCGPTASGATVPVGTVTVTCTATDAAHNASQKSFTITVRDTGKPIVTTQGDIVTEATGPGGAVVVFTVSANDPQIGPVTPTCVPASGSTFGLGTKTVTCTAMNNAGNQGSATFNVRVNDTTAPSLTVPADFAIDQASPGGVSLTYTASATDLVSGAIAPSCSPASGSTITVGQKTVTCTATDSANNSVTKSFMVTVRDKDKPVVTTPANITAEATAPGGAVVTFTASASDPESGPLTATCVPASGSTFGIGTNVVTCTAIDGAGNPGSSSFNVTVRDTTPPSVTVPSDIVVEATGPSGAMVSFSASASDTVSGSLTPACSKTPGSTFAVGVTKVTCTAKDAAQNSASASFNVTVRDTTAPAIASLTPSVPSLWPLTKGLIAETIAVSASDAVTMPPSCAIASVSSNEAGGGQWQITGPLAVSLLADRNGNGNGRLYTITVSCRDAAGNAMSATTTVVVPHDQGKGK
jgi:microsomal dipeptidase-like Zn-dependent dipeptidase